MNFHLENDKNSETRELKEIKAAFNLESRISEPTHKAGHSLDALLSRNDSTFTLRHNVTDIGYSDHFLVELFRNISRNSVRKTVTNRRIKDIDIENFTSDVKTKLNISPDIDFKQAVDTYNVTIREVLVKQAPLKTKNLFIRRNTKWFNDQSRRPK